MPKNNEGLEQLLMHELQDLLDAEKQLVRALPKMAKAVTDEELENALREHLEVTKGQVQRLEQVFASMEMRPKSRPCAGMRGLVEEGQHIIEEDMEEALLDTALTAAGRKVEHYEMVAYESCFSLARELGQKEAAGLLRESMDEEAQADKTLAAIAKRLLKTPRPENEEQSEEEEEETPSRGRVASSQRGSSQRASSGRSSAAKNGRSSAKNGGSSAKKASSGGRSRGSQKNAGGSAHPLTDHDEIRQWAEERGAQPSCVKKTGGGGDVGMIRLDFPGYTGAESLQEISWDDWFEKFDESGLALVVQDATARGQKSNFNKLVKRETAEDKSRSAR